VLTGGGAQLKHLKHLVELMTGMSTRIGYPNEHIAKSAVEDVTSPLHATGVGLVMKGFDYLDRRRPRTVVHNTASREPVKSHSKRTFGDFFSTVLSGATDLLKDDDN
jgi:cell division protein FtsA